MRGFMSFGAFSYLRQVALGRIAIGAAAGGLLLAIGGCDSSPQQESRRDVAAPSGILLDDPMSGATEPPAQDAAAEPVVQEPAEPAFPSRPDDFGKWQWEDFAAAKDEGDPRLPEAVSDLAQRFPTSDNVAKLMVQMLSDATPATGTGSPAAPVESLHRSVISALCQNESATATAAVKNLLLGTTKTALPRQDVFSILISGLAANVERPALTDEYTKIFLALLVRPAKILGDSAGGVTEQWIQDEVLRQYGPKGTARFRAALATAITAADFPEDLAPTLIEYLLVDSPENAQAQIVLFASPLVDEQTRSQMQQRFLGPSQEALAGLMGVANVAAEAQPVTPTIPDDDASSPAAAAFATANDQVDAATMARPAEPAEPAKFSADQLLVVQRLWRPAVMAGIADKLPDPPPPEANDPLAMNDPTAAGMGASGGAPPVSQADGEALQLLASMPAWPARLAVGDFITPRLKEGPGPLKALGEPGASISDPMLLYMFKAAYLGRQSAAQQEAMAQQAASGGRGGRGGRRGRGGGGGGGQIGQDPSQTQSVGDDWLEAVKDLSVAWNSRLAAIAQPPTGKKVELPVPLINIWTPTTLAHLSWPEDLPAGVDASAVAPMEIFYYRYDGEEKYSRFLPTIKKQLADNLVASEVAGDTLWISSVSPGPHVNNARSVDLRFTFTTPLTDERSLNIKQAMVIEVLCMEFPPAGAK